MVRSPFKFILVLLFTALAPSHYSLAGEHIVRIISDYENLRMYYDPKLIIINEGDTVTWINEKKEDHNIMSFPDGFPKSASPFKSPDLTAAGEKWSKTFNVSGTYEYHCLPHIPMGMHGTIIVGAPSANDDFHQPTSEELAAYRGMLLEYFDEEEYPYTASLKPERKQ